MKFHEFQTLSKRTLNPESGFKSDNYILGLFGEGGEVVDIVKKLTYQGHTLEDQDKNGVSLKDLLDTEIGDCSWYIASEATNFSIDIGETLETMPNLLLPSECPVSLCKLYMQTVCVIDKTRRDINFIIDNQHGDEELEPVKAQYVLALCKLVRILIHLCHFYNLNYRDVLKNNVNKLIIRYPDKFDHIRSVNR